MSKPRFLKGRPKNVLQVSLSSLQSFSYKYGDCSLVYSLTVDTMDQPKKYREILLQGIKDLDELIASNEPDAGGGGGQNAANS